MRSVVVTSVASSAPVQIDQSQCPINVGLAVILNVGGSGGTYQVDYTYDDIDNTPAASWTWFQFAALSSAAGTGTKDGTLTAPARAVRLTVLSLPTGGTTPGYTMLVRQAGQRSL